MICVYVNYLGLDVTAEIELKDIGAESKVALDDLCKKAVDGCLRNEQFQHHHLTQASSVTGSYDNAWRKHDLARYGHRGVIRTEIDIFVWGLALRLSWLVQRYDSDLLTNAVSVRSSQTLADFLSSSMWEGLIP